MSSRNRLREVLSKIAELASSAGNEDWNEGHDDFDDGEGYGNGDEQPGCVIKALPNRLLVKAAEVAVKINPVNAPLLGPGRSLLGGTGIIEPGRLALLTAKYWGPSPRTLSVSFMESTPNDLQTRIISHLNAWSNCCGIKFTSTSGTGQVRISRGSGGYYSYLGTDVLLIPQNRQTMNLQGFTMSTPESEYKRVVRHEAGHTLGFPHEHARKDIVMRIDPNKAYAWFWQTYGWDKATVDAQVLTPLDDASLMGTPADQTSIMCYQLPGSITKDGQPILGGTDINSTDCKFATKVYPKAGKARPSMLAPAVDDEAWSEAEDVEVAV